METHRSKADTKSPNQLVVKLSLKCSCLVFRADVLSNIYTFMCLLIIAKIKFPKVLP